MQRNKEKGLQIVRLFFKTIYIIVTQSLQTIILVLIAMYHDRLLEFALITIGYQIGRAAFGESYHAKTLISCTFVSALIFGTTTMLVPTTEESLILQVISGVGIAFLMWIIESIRKYNK